MRSLFVAVVMLSALAVVSAMVEPHPSDPSASSTGGAQECPLNTSLGIVVDTSQSWDIVANTMKAALNLVGSHNAPVLSFQNYYLSTWNFEAADVKSFAAITELNTFFVTSGIGNVRAADESKATAHDDWAYMLESLYEQVKLASDYGMIVVLGDEDQLCDGEGTKHRFDAVNPPYNALIPLIEQTAMAKHLKISFYYFIAAGTDGNGCPVASRAWPMGQVGEIASMAGPGQAMFAQSGLDEAMSLEIKLRGKVSAVCPGCVQDSTLAFVVDTSVGSGADRARQMKAIAAKLYGGLFAKSATPPQPLHPFHHYVLTSWAAATPTPVSYPTFPALVSAMAMKNPAGDDWNEDYFVGNDSNVAQKGNDWLYMINSLKETLNHVGAGGFMVVINDEDAFCAPYLFPGDPNKSRVWALELQQFINAAVAKQVQLAWFQFAGGYADAAEATACTSVDAAFYTHLADGRADATALILAGDAMLHIDVAHEAQAIDHLYSQIFSQSWREPCAGNCSHDATLAFVLDTSDSSAPLKEDNYKTWFNSLPPLGLASFQGGFELNTWEQKYDEILHYSSLADLNAYVQGAALLAKRVEDDDPRHDHDDWRYMLENLPYTIASVGKNKNGVVIVLADDNQICDAHKFGHNSSDADFVLAVQRASQLGVAISYFQFATDHTYCQPGEMTDGHQLAQMLAQATGGSFFFGTVTSDAGLDAEFAQQVVPVLKAADARELCPQTCEEGAVWCPRRNKCMPINPCDVVTCQNGGVCVGQLFSPHYTCDCSVTANEGFFFYGKHCEFECVPRSFSPTPDPPQMRHVLSLVVDTSDSTGYALMGVAQGLAAMAKKNGAFDHYLLSTWAYTTETPNGGLVHDFASANEVISELGTVSTQRNHRLDADYGKDEIHDDWRYMLDSVQAVLESPLIGRNGVLVVLTDLEGICDANPETRPAMVNGTYTDTPRYPDNPQSARIAQLNQLALNTQTAVFFVTYPSSDANFGYCNAAQKQVGKDAALDLVAWTGGAAESIPAYNSDANAKLVSALVVDVITTQGLVERCDCPSGFVPSAAAANMCVYPDSNTSQQPPQPQEPQQPQTDAVKKVTK